MAGEINDDGKENDTETNGHPALVSLNISFVQGTITAISE